MSLARESLEQSLLDERSGRLSVPQVDPLEPGLRRECERLLQLAQRLVLLAVTNGLVDVQSHLAHLRDGRQ